MKPRFALGQQDGVAFFAAVLLAFAFLFGGASRLNELREAFVELAALPVIVLVLLRWVKSPEATGALWRDHAFFLLILLGALFLPLMQLLPLPPGVWNAVPGRDDVRLAQSVAELSVGWGTLTLNPDETWKTFLFLLAPAAGALAVLASPPSLRLRLVVIFLTAGLLCIALAAAQVSVGRSMSLWTTAAFEPSGLFANRNHMAILCLATIPFALAFGTTALREGGERRSLILSMVGVYVALVTIALAVILSRAGILLFAPVLFIGLAAMWKGAGARAPSRWILGIVLAVGAALGAVVFVALPPIMERFGASEDGRLIYWPGVVEAAQAYLPFGSGFGSFDAVYRSVEPLELLSDTYLNHAHNDYLELWLEGGWPAVVLILAFFVWFARRTWTAWRRPAGLEADLQRAATIAMGAVLLHSIGDYPLRTLAMATLFAVLAAILEMRGDQDERAPRRRRRRTQGS